MKVQPSGAVCGATVSGVDLSGELDANLIAEIRDVWLRHRVLEFSGQSMDDDALERFTLAMGGFGEDPFFEPITGRRNIAAILREADETSPLFAENWHTDWSFLPKPPAGTCLLAIDIPTYGGDTLFADQIAAFAALRDERKTFLRGLTAIHSAKGAYSPDGTYGKKDTGRSMAIKADESALATRAQPLIQKHPETGEEGIFSCAGYIIGLEGYSDEEAFSILGELLAWQSSDAFVYTHKWNSDSLVMWDNRAVLHRATGGYEGQRRELHRTTIAA